MVRKRGSYDRIEKVVSKKQRFCIASETPSNASLKKERNLLSENMLNLYEMNKQKELLSENEPKKSIENLEPPNKIEKVFEKKKTDFNLKYSTITLSDVGGLDEIIKVITEKYFFSELYNEIGTGPNGSFLLYGPPGCGKTLIARAIAGEFNLPYIEVSPTKLVHGISGESENKIREMFDEAVKNAPCILFIDEIDAIIPSRETSNRGMETRMVAEMLKCLDELNEKGTSSNVILIAATNMVDSIDEAFRRGGRFDAEFLIGIPDEEARFAILQVLSRKIKLAENFDMKWLAHHTPGYVGADLQSLIKNAATVCIRRICKKFGSKFLGFKEEEFELDLKSQLELCKKWKISDEECGSAYIELQDFQIALQDFIPYSRRKGFALVPNVTWEDVGALEDIKKELQKSIIWPIKYRNMCKLSNMKISSTGILLYGPKGCGKTLLAKAIANECNINFLSVKGSELLNMYVGQSEKNVRICFQRAKNAAPCIIFFDEFDALCPVRSHSNTNAVADRVVNQLLSEMNGIEERDEVFVIAATNLPGKIDYAMLRAGRLEKYIYVGLPSADDRIKILKSITKNKTQPKIADDVDFKVIAFDTRCENFSGADLEFLVREASLAAFEDHITISDTDIRSGHIIEIKLKHFDYAFNKMKSSVNEDFL